jgi:hypothetical protein
MTTPKPQGPAKNTAAPSRGSTDEQNPATLRDQYEPELQLIADEAEKFPAATSSVSDCLVRPEEWVQKTAATVKAYGERLRDLLRDEDAMKTQEQKDRPIFDFQIGRVLRAVRKTYDSLFERGYTPPPRRIKGQIHIGSDALDDDIQSRMRRHKNNILKARNEPFEEFYKWRAEDPQRRHADEKIVAVPHRESRGRKAHERHFAVYRIVKKYVQNVAPEWWRQPHLENICLEFDSEPKVKISTRLKTEFGTWTKAIKQERGRKAVIEAIRRSLKFVEKRS